MYKPLLFKYLNSNFNAINISRRLWDPSSIIISNSLTLNWSTILLMVLIIFISLLISTPKTWILLDSYLKFEIFMSKQKIFAYGKYFEKAAAEAPAKEQISNILII